MTVGSGSAGGGAVVLRIGSQLRKLGGQNWVVVWVQRRPQDSGGQLLD